MLVFSFCHFAPPVSLFISASLFCLLKAISWKHHSQPSLSPPLPCGPKSKLNVRLLHPCSKIHQKTPKNRFYLSCDFTYSACCHLLPPSPCTFGLAVRISLILSLRAEKYFLQVPTKCRMHRTLQDGEVSLRNCRVFAALPEPHQGTTLAAGIKRSPLCGLPVCEEERQQLL